MSGFVHCVDFRTPDTFITSGAGAADATFPHSFAADIAHPNRPWKSAGNAVPTVTYYAVDWGSALALDGVAVDNYNGAAFALQADSVSTFDSVNLITADYAVTQNQVDGRYKCFADLDGTDFDGHSRRYWRILAGLGTPIGGSAPMQIGSVAWCKTLVRWTSGTSSYAELPLEATRVNDDFAGGGAEPVILGNRYGAITLAGSPADRASMRSNMLSLLGQGLGRPFLFYKNDGDTSDFLIAHRAGDVSLKQTAPLLMEFDNFIMRGVV